MLDRPPRNKETQRGILPDLAIFLCLPLLLHIIMQLAMVMALLEQYLHLNSFYAVRGGKFKFLCLLSLDCF